MDAKPSNMFKKKPMVVEARRFDGGNGVELLRWMNVVGCDNPKLHPTDRPVLYPNKGDDPIYTGDWVVKNEDGGFSFWSPEIFEEMYEPL